MDTPDEEWRVIQGFPHYEVSNLGRVRSRRRKVCRWRASHAKDSWRESPVLLAGSRTRRGYIAFILRMPDGLKPYRKLAHRLVAEQFLHRPDGRVEVCHNDGNPSNNAATNLRWDSHRNNQRDMLIHGTVRVTAKLSAQDVADIREEVARDGRGSQVRLACKFGVSKAQISRIVNGTRWRITSSPAP